MSLKQGTKTTARAWPKRRQWLDRIARDPRLTRGCKALLLLLAGRSDDAAKPVWGCQAKLSAQADVSVRSIGRYVAEAEALGYLQVFRARPTRGPDGRWCRRRSNSMYLCLPPVSGPLEAPRRVKPAGRCVVSSHQRRPYLADSPGQSSPFGERQPACSTPEVAIPAAEPWQEATDDPPLRSGPALFAALRAQLSPRSRR